MINNHEEGSAKSYYTQKAALLLGIKLGSNI